MAKRKLYTFPWHIHPSKTPAWYEEQKLRLAPDAFAREIDISYEFSASGTVFSEFGPEHILETPYQFNADLPLYRSLDFGRTCAAMFAQRDAYGRFIFFREVILEPSSTTELAQTVKNISAQYASFTTKPFDTCDPAGNTVSYTANHSDIKILNEYEIFPVYDRIQQSRERLKEGVSLIKHLLSERNASKMPNIRISRQGCPKLIEAFQSEYKYKTNRSTGEVLDTIEEVHPYEDVMDCLRYTLLQFSSHDPKKPAFNPGIARFKPDKRR